MHALVAHPGASAIRSRTWLAAAPQPRCPHRGQPVAHRLATGDRTAPIARGHSGSFTAGSASFSPGSGSGEGSAAASSGSALEAARKQLRELEEERDAAVARAESCARAAMKLTDLVSLLENMALEKVRSGDEEVAKQVLQEKAAAKEVLERTSTKAQVNYSLAARLADKIGSKQRDILALLKDAGGASEAPAAARAAAPPPPPPPPAPRASSASSWSTSSAGAAASWSTAGSGGSAASGYGGSYGGAASSSSAQRQYSGMGTDGTRVEEGTYVPGKPKWQESLEQAKQRIGAAEKAGDQAVLAARLTAEESIAAARQRLREQATESVLAARSRLSGRPGPEESIKEAQERLRAQDAEVLAYVQRIMQRYRRGEYVAEEELEFAFQQLEKRFLL